MTELQDRADDTTTGAVDPDRLMAFVLKAVDEVGATLNAALVVMGDKLGYYRAMVASGPTTPARLADDTGTGEPYAREWLNAQAAGGYVEYDPASATYRLPAEQAVALTDEDSPAFLPGFFQIALGTVHDTDDVLEAARNGSGVGWHEHVSDVHVGCERFFRPGYHAHLVAEWLPALDGVVDRLERGARVDLTGRTEAGFAEIVVHGVTAWVRAADTGANPPPAEVEEAVDDAVVARGSVPQGVSGEPCPGGSAVESGLRASTITTYRAVCAAFPGLSYGGLRPGDDGEHGTGEALDIMVDRATGDRVVAYLQENATRLGVDNVIWRQRIWFVGDAFTQWKAMADRGSPTANHYDHVHVGTR